MLGLPERTLYNRKIPKNKFYEKLAANSRIKELFVEQIDSIVWKHKLSRETTNLEPTEAVQEVQVFEIHLRQRELNQELLEKIDRAVPYPILHLLRYGDEAKLMIAYKERHTTNENRSVVQAYYQSDWQPLSRFTVNILQGLTLEAVYENLVRHLMPSGEEAATDLQAAVERQQARQRLERECARLEAKIRSEVQFDKKVEMNLRLRQLQRQLETDQ